MTAGDAELLAIVTLHLGTDETLSSRIYVAQDAIAGGTVLNLPHTEITAPWDAQLVFVDLEPQANWSHSSRYLLVRVDHDEVLSIESRFPPFGSTESPDWRLLSRPTV
jgi:hypothetical protein